MKIDQQIYYWAQMLDEAFEKNLAVRELSDSEVPVKVLRSWLMNRRNAIGLEEIEKALELCPVAVITADEDKRLNAAGFCSKMPDGEYDVLSGDPWTKHKAVGIKMHESMSA